MGHGPMDRTHQEFVVLIDRLLQASEGEMAALMAALAEHTEEHFTTENRWMEESAFPPRQCHIDEHAAVLKSIEEVRALVNQGDCSAVHALAQALADWFPAHADYLDSALAHWLCKQQMGGKPVVLRRNLELR